MHERVLLYYSARFAVPVGEGKEPKTQQLACVLESADGVRFERPRLGHLDISDHFPPGTDTAYNNVVWKQGPATHHFTPFLDANPAAPPEERFKAIGRHPRSSTAGGVLAVFKSPDGFHWDMLHDRGFATPPTDSQNGAFWDPLRKHYVAYMRGLDKVRTVRTCVSPDLVTWTEPRFIDYSDERSEHLYTNGIRPYYRAPHLYLGLPARFAQSRTKIPGHGHPGVSDGVLMSSRDGILFHRWEEAFVRPGPEPGMWTERSNFPALGMVQTGPSELSIYWVENYRHPAPVLRRGTLRLDGFASLHAGAAPGEMLTRPFVFRGSRLSINYATSAVGHLRFELCDPDGVPIDGFAQGGSERIFGNEIDHTVRWKDGANLASLAGRPVRLRVRLHDADLFSFRFTDQPEPELPDRLPVKSAIHPAP